MVAKRKYQHTFRVPKDTSLPLKYWRAIIELKPHENGDRRRRYVNSKDRDKAEALAVQLTKDKKETSGEMPTRALTVSVWFEEWFEPIHVPEIKPKTADTYRGLINREILPALGQIKLERLSAQDVRRMLTAVTTTSGRNKTGLSSTTAMQVHRILVVALKAAMIDGHIPRNVASLVKAPRKAATQLTALTAEQGRKVLEAANTDELRSLWYAVLHTGARQGELLGLEIDRFGDVLDLSWQLQRLTWQHGCSPFCERKRGSDCPKRKVTAPADWKARYLTGGLWLTEPKSKKGTRVVPVNPTLYAEITKHLDATAHMPNPFGLVWRMPNGKPIDPRVQSEAWDALLKRAGVPDVRLHDGRHTTVDMLYELDVPEDEISNIVGHSTRSTTRGYKSNVNLKRRSDAMNKVAAHLKPIPPDTPQVVVLSPAAPEQSPPGHQSSEEPPQALAGG